MAAYCNFAVSGGSGEIDGHVAAPSVALGFFGMRHATDPIKIAVPIQLLTQHRDAAVIGGRGVGHTVTIMAGRASSGPGDSCCAPYDGAIRLAYVILLGVLTFLNDALG